jgi:hypothetical protein
MPGTGHPRNPDEIKPHELAYIEALEARMGEEVAAIMSGYVRGVILKPTGLSRTQEFLARKVAQEEGFDLREW